MHSYKRNKDENTHRYAVRGKKIEIEWKRESEREKMERKRVRGRGVEREIESPETRKGGQEKVYTQLW